jgi:hypothetical protein
MSGSVGPVVHEHHTVERGAATSARVEIGMTAGELEVKSGAKMLFEGNFDFNVPVLKPEIAYAVEGTTGTLKVSQGSTSGNYENSWRLSLDETTPVDLHLTLGAGDAELVLGRVNLQSLAVRLGAGDLVLDLRGMPATSYKVTVQAGAPAPVTRRFACRRASAFPQARPASLAIPMSAASRSGTDAGSIRARRRHPSPSICRCSTLSAISGSWRSSAR